MPVNELFSLTGRVAVVTGGSRGLGREMAIGLAGAGAKLAISARRDQWLIPTATELEAAGHACFAHTCDVSDETQVAAFTAATMERYGRIDILVNNAGISWGASSLDMPIERFRQVLNVNATGSFLMARAAAHHMRAIGSGKIINVSSIMGMRGTPPDVVSAAGYSASKGALISLTRALAVEWAPYGITVNAIAPGFFPTRLSEGVIAGHEDQLLNRIPLRRFGTENDIRGAAIFLASSASDYLTGHTLVLDGGATAT